MRNAFIVILLGLFAAPVSAQQPPPFPMPPDFAKIEQARVAAKAASLNALSPDHRTQVQAIVDQFNLGNITMCEAAVKIGAILNQSEALQVLAQDRKLHESMPMLSVRTLKTAPHPPAGMEKQVTVSTAGGVAFYRELGPHKPDPGEVLLMLLATP